MFEKLIGNETVKTSLRRLLESGRIPNSLLFAGPEGVGKKQFALALAQSFVCGNADGERPCGACGACRRALVFDIPSAEKRENFRQVFSSAHPDVGMVVPFNKNILVDAIRDLEREANYRPYEAKARFFIIDDADKMNDAASNALLKTLEEPPATSYIVLVSSRPDSLLQTILSRCQVIRFTPVSSTEIEAHLIATGKFSPEDARLAARLSAGSIGRALSILPDEIRTRRSTMLQVLESVLVRRDRAALLAISETLADAKNKDNFETDITILESLIHDVWTLKLGDSPEDIANPDLADQLFRLSKGSVTQELAAWMREIEQLRERTEVNINKRIATDALFMKMAS
jgi:DNA polymerase III subunit delta'